MCIFLNCDRVSDSLGYCKSHYMQYRRGNGLKPLRIINNPQARFWSKVDKSGAHWIWIPGPKDEHGYGQFSVGKKKVYPHRFSYEINVGIIPDHLEIDHKCRIKLCVRPEHLRAVTRIVNANNRNDNRPIVDNVVYCRRGHAIIDSNLYIRKDGRIECRVCINRPQATEVTKGR